ncbi:Maf family protein [Pseudofulvimonas gallinarii]|uniref:dTTP/UTP pyrophosphatase n=1 Tax=Pseudofulvimonas gallinarii TaxID=634155 RepID=A0A4V3UU18_9GAMM|nr:Maf family protein [Pseudofulvimonas gallinarii]TCT00766.1 septum formation protein [Pseudofulvimonas gallinarii]THD12801.1 septum formation inhibitor Maf [Pseudofulvimonas gallinarii]
MAPILYLASKSPRRRQLLGQLGVDFEVLDVDIPEAPEPGESPVAYVERLARAKAAAGRAALAVGAGGDGWVLGSDTEVVLDGEIFGKPVDEAGAAAMLSRLAGREHEVLTGVCLAGPPAAGPPTSLVCTTRVRFDALDEAAIRVYVATGEPFGKAGAYAIQGRAAAFTSHLSGSYSGVMGLPLFETARLLRAAGFAV